MGMANAAVFPVPFCALPSTSFLFRIRGIAFPCTGVGMLYSSFLSAFNTGSIILRSSNVILISGLIRIRRKERCINEATKVAYLLKLVFIRTGICSYIDDMDDPAGGVRHVIPERGRY